MKQETEASDRYRKFVKAHFKEMLTYRHSVLHAAVGISTEAGEILDVLKKAWVYEQPINFPHLKEEMGDLLFYFTALCDLLEVTPAHLRNMNMDKLKKRYPKGYTDEDAVRRQDESS